MSVNKAGKIRVMRILLGCLCFCGIVVSPDSRDPAGRQAAAQSGRSFSLRVDVELVTAEVIVLDKKGKPVSNLKKEDFRLYEDGKEQEIISFDEVTAEPGNPSPGLASMEEDDLERGKTVLIIFDDSTITPAHIKRSRDSAERFVREHMRPQDLFAVASYDNSLKILQNFTREPEDILKAIAQPAVSSADMTPDPRLSTDTRRSSGTWPTQDAPSSTKGYKLGNLLRALHSLNLAIEHLKGSKSVLLFSESGYFSADIIDTLYKNTLNSAKRSNVVFYTIDPAGLDSRTIGELHKPEKNPAAFALKKSSQPASSSKGFSALSWGPNSGSRSFLGNSMFQQQGGGTGGGTSGGTGGTSGGTGGGTSGGTGAGTGSGTGAGSGTSGGTSGTTGGTTGSSTGGNTGSGTRGYPDSNMSGYPDSSIFPDSRNPNNMNPWEDNSSMSLLKSLASDTGGLSIYNTNNYDVELDKLDQQLSNYYILGFQSNNPKHDGAFRKLEVKTSLKGLKLRYRKGYLDRRPIDALASSRQEKTLLNALAAPEPATQLPLVFRPAYFYDSPRMARVLVLAKIRAEKAEVKKKGGQSTCDLNVMGVAYAEDGSVSARFSETMHFAFDKEKEKDFRQANLSYRNYFRLRPGKYRLKLATSDEANNLGSMEQFLEVPAPPERGFTASSLVLAENVSRLPGLIQNLQAKLLDDSDPLIYAGMQITPSVDNRIKIGSAVPILFKIYSIAGGGQWDLTAKVRLISEEGKEVALLPVALDNNLSLINKSEAIIGFSMNFPDVQPGKYSLVVETTDNASTQAATARADVEFTAQ